MESQHFVSESSVQVSNTTLRDELSESDPDCLIQERRLQPTADINLQ
jgi:hypothetical protein